MTFRQRLILVFSLIAVMTGGLISLVLLRASVTNMQQTFIATYRNLGDAIAGGFVESERTSDILMQNAAAMFARLPLVREDGNPLSQADLAKLADKLQVDTLNIFSARTGEALRLSNFDDVAKAINVFDLCPEYRNLASDARPTVTAFLPNFGNRPAKYAMAMSADGRFIVNAGVFQTHASDFLRRATAHDGSIRGLRLLAPNGQTAFSVGVPPLDGAPASEPWYGHRLRGDEALFSFLVPSASGVCCECRQKGLIAADGPYFYRLEMTVTTASLREAMQRQVTWALATFATVCFVALAIGCWLIGRMTSGIRAIAATADEVVAHRGWDVKAPGANAADDVGKLAAAFNRMLSALQEEEARKLDIERMRCKANIGRQVAHDIRAPLAALGVAYSDFRNLPEDRRRLVAGAISRIEGIANNLLEVHGEANPVARPEADGVRFRNISPIVEQVVREFIATSGAGWVVRYAIGEGLRARVDGTVFARLLSNLLQKMVTEDAKHRELQVAVRGEGRSVYVRLNFTGKVPVKLPRQDGDEHADVGIREALATVVAWGGGLSLRPLPDSGVSIELTLRSGDIVLNHRWGTGSPDAVPSQDN